MSHAFSVWAEALPALLAATAKVTIPLSLISFALAFVLAVGVALARFEKVPVLGQLGALYVWIFRGTPLLVQLFIVFFGLPAVGIVIPAWPAAIITLTLNTAAYAAEALRSGLKAVPAGQWEAGRTLNLSHWQIIRHIVAPQTLRISLPTLNSNFIDLVKGTSLVSTITLVDLVNTSQQIVARNFEPLLLYVEVAAIYLAINTVLTAVQSRLEARTSRYVEGT